MQVEHFADGKMLTAQASDDELRVTKKESKRPSSVTS